jgi:hypothetical protein
MGSPTIGRIVLYRTDGRGGPSYDLPAVITGTAASHPDAGPEDLSGGWSWRDVPGNPVPIPCTFDGYVHLHVMTPGPSGQYTELTVPFDDGGDERDGEPRARSWRWPRRV